MSNIYLSDILSFIYKVVFLPEISGCVFCLHIRMETHNFLLVIFYLIVYIAIQIHTQNVLKLKSLLMRKPALECLYYNGNLGIESDGFFILQIGQFFSGFC